MKEDAMPGPTLPPLELTGDEQHALEVLVRRHTAPQQVVLRARIILLAADGLTNSQIARTLGVEADTVRLWRQRWRTFQGVALADLSVVERLTDAPRPGCPARITPEQVCRIVALACEAPSASGRPISQWTGRELAAEIVGRGIVPTISARHAARLLKRGTFSRT
jgi:transposase-like protein